MDFNHSERSIELQDQVRAFLAEHVYPAEPSTTGRQPRTPPRATPSAPPR